MNRWIGLDVLRAYAVIFVMMYHFPESESHSIFGAFKNIGFFGVETFFVLSGFLISYQLFGKKGEVHFGKFFLRRWFRTLPAFYFVLLLYLTLPGFREEPNLIPLWKLLTFTANLDMTFAAFSYIWTLCIEEQFYFLLPFLTVFLRGRIGLRSGIALSAALAVGGIALRAWLYQTKISGFHLGQIEFYHAYFAWIYYPTWSHIDGFLWGILIAAIVRFRPDIWHRVSSHANMLFVVGLVGLAIGMLLLRDRFSLLATSLVFSVNALGGAFMTAAAVAGSTWLRALYIPGATHLALMSYSVYLLHRPMFHLSQKVYFEWMGDGFGRFAFAFALALAAGAVLHLTVERPFLILRDRWIKSSN